MTKVSNRHTLYAQVVAISHPYLGPAAERFITRQIHNHLHKDPLELTHEDLHSLIDWVRVAVSFITEDTHIVEEYASRLKQLAAEQGKQT